MNTLQHLGFAALLLSAPLALAGCGSSQTSTSPALEDTSSALVDAEVYVCRSGEKVRAAYPDVNTAVIEYRGDVHTLEIAVSADGARYVNDDVQWWIKGFGTYAEATLFDQPDGSYQDALEVDCRPE